MNAINGESQGVARHRGRSIGLAAVLLLAAVDADAAGALFGRALAEQRGQITPLPWGVGLVYSDGRQDLQLDNLSVQANGNTADATSLVHLGASELKSSTLLLKADVWLLPVLNLFAFAGQSSNDLTADFYVEGDEVAAYYGSTACSDPASPDRPAFCDRRFDGRIQRQSDATNYGGGALLAYAAGPWFATLSLVYLDSQARDQDTDVQAFTATPRLGWRSAPSPSGRLALYAGASFVDSQVELRNQQQIDINAPRGNVPDPIVLDYSVAQTNEDDWSYLAGANWDISPRWTLQAEYAVGARVGLTSSLVWRFGD